MHVALGREYRGRRVRQGSVVYAVLEGAKGFRARVEAFRREKLSDADSTPPPFHLMASSFSLVADHVAFLADIRAQLGDEKPSVVVIDTLNRSYAGSENDDKDMSAYVRAADAIRAAFGCAVIIIHHSGHGAERPRGHSLLMGALDIQIAVKRDQATKNITATLELAKDVDVGAEIVSRLAPVIIGYDDDNDPITSCIVLPVEGLAEGDCRSAANIAKPTKSAKAALRALKMAIDECGAVPPASNHVPAGVKTVTIDQWRDYAYRTGISTSDKPHAKGVAFNRASVDLVDAGKIGIWKPHVWAV
jgi:hypothetical protein